MKQVNIQDLLEKQKNGSISPAEQSLLEAWYAQWQPESLEISQQELETVKAEVWKSVNPRKNKIVVLGLWYRVAAAVLILFVSASVYYRANKNKMLPAKTQIVAKVPVFDFKPGGNKALLTLSGGQQIVLNDAKNGKLASQGAAVVSKTANGQITYGAISSKGAFGSIFNTLTTPRGGQYSLTLSDGTKVWLNAASSITYPVIFGPGERDVKVVGEVYFEVAHNANKPFKVSAANQEVSVLGTHFNIKAYPDDPAAHTTLLAGSIKIKNTLSGESQMLIPGQQARLANNNDPIKIKTVKADDAISWKNGYFLFDNQDINSVMRIMSRWYDVDIAYNHVPNGDRFGGTFSRSSNMSEILHNFERVGRVRFQIEAKKILVTN